MHDKRFHVDLTNNWREYLEFIQELSLFYVIGKCSYVSKKRLCFKFSDNIEDIFE